ncbi:hypothetical protein PsYK624_070330 [Phanerochaete sordida]|uniref:Uncharacterized protein n=1 Tax=Phanerochaete sordida TaxID=48140 RepID=A0A9P3GA70_9APHY|nr:hypothetical protein PsYK624_070330 [Phanerochaete sordida]
MVRRHHNADFERRFAVYFRPLCRVRSPGGQVLDTLGCAKSRPLHANDGHAQSRLQTRRRFRYLNFQRSRSPNSSRLASVSASRSLVSRSLLTHSTSPPAPPPSLSSLAPPPSLSTPSPHTLSTPI